MDYGVYAYGSNCKRIIAFFFWRFSISQKYFSFFFLCVQFKISSGIRQNVSLINPHQYSPSLLQMLCCMSEHAAPEYAYLPVGILSLASTAFLQAWSSYPWAAACPGTQRHPLIWGYRPLSSAGGQSAGQTVRGASWMQSSHMDITSWW